MCFSCWLFALLFFPLILFNGIHSRRQLVKVDPKKREKNVETFETNYSSRIMSFYFISATFFCLLYLMSVMRYKRQQHNSHSSIQYLLLEKWERDGMKWEYNVHIYNVSCIVILLKILLGLRI